MLRTDHGLSRKDLAREVDISYSYLTEIENGNKPPSNTILGAIAAVLGMQLHERIADAELRVAPADVHGELQPPQAALWSGPGRERPAPPSMRRQMAMRAWPSSAEGPPQDELQPTYPAGATIRSGGPRVRACVNSRPWSRG